MVKTDYRFGSAENGNTKKVHGKDRRDYKPLYICICLCVCVIYHAFWYSSIEELKIGHRHRTEPTQNETPHVQYQLKNFRS